MAIELDIFALGGLLGYTPEETKSIRDICIDANHMITVGRFVQDPSATESKKLYARQDADGQEHFAIHVDDIFAYSPKRVDGPSPQANYVKLSKSATRALAERQSALLSD